MFFYNCSAGIGRTGTYIALDALYKCGKATGKINVAEYVKAMRSNRMNMIQTYVRFLFSFRLTNIINVVMRDIVFYTNACSIRFLSMKTPNSLVRKTDLGLNMLVLLDQIIDNALRPQRARGVYSYLIPIFENISVVVVVLFLFCATYELFWGHL